MPIPLIAIPIVAGLAKIGSTIIAGEMTKSSNEKARTEARQLAETTRRDTLKQQRFENVQAFKRSGMADERLEFNKEMAEKNVALGDEDIRRSKGKADRSVIEGAVAGMKPQDEDWMYKQKVLSRF